MLRWRSILGGGRVRAAAVALAALAGAHGYAKYLNGVYPLADWLVWPVLALWGYCGFLSAACVSAGYALVARFFDVRGWPVLARLVASFALGLTAFVIAMYALGAVGLFRPWVAVALPAAMIAAGTGPLVAWRRSLARARNAAPIPRPHGQVDVRLPRVVVTLAAIFGAVYLLFVYLQTFTPAAINFDAQWCHVTVGADYARHGRIVPFPSDYARDMPQLKSLVDTWAFLVPGLRVEVRWMLSLHLEMVAFAWTLVGVAALAGQLVGGVAPRAAWAGFFLFPAVLVYDSNLGGAADHYLALFAPPLFVAALRAAEEKSARSAALAGAFAGAALLTKYQAVYLILGAGLVLGGPLAVAWLRERSRASLGPLVRAGGAFAAALVLVSAPHFLKNLIFYKNPVYPFAQGLFTGSTPTSANAAFLFEEVFQDARYRPEGPLAARLGSALGMTLGWSFSPHYSFVGSYPISGSLFTLSLPMIPFVRAPRRIAWAAGGTLAALFAWALVFRVDRHLQIVMPLCAAVTVATLAAAWRLGWAARAGVAALVLLQVVWGGDALVITGEQRLRAALELIGSGYAKRAATRFDFRREHREVSAALPPDARVMYFGRDSLGIDRDLFSGYPGAQAFFDYQALRDPRDLWEMLHARGITHLLFPAGRKPALAKQVDLLYAELMHRHAGPAQAVGGFTLVALPAEPPSAEAPYPVLALGLAGYRDGLYSADQLNVLEMWGRPWLSFPEPRAPWPADARAQAAVLSRARAALIGERAPAARAVGDVLRRDFAAVQGFPGAFALYLRQ